MKYKVLMRRLKGLKMSKLRKFYLEVKKDFLYFCGQVRFKYQLVFHTNKMVSEYFQDRFMRSMFPWEYSRNGMQPTQYSDDNLNRVLCGKESIPYTPKKRRPTFIQSPTKMDRPINMKSDDSLEVCVNDDMKAEVV